jgi:hypothetical protein
MRRRDALKALVISPILGMSVALIPVGRTAPEAPSNTGKDESFVWSYKDVAALCRPTGGQLWVNSPEC